MPEQCFRKKDSYPPVCGVHKVVVVQKQIAIDANAPSLGRVTCLICPVSRVVVREMARPYARI